jgi:hypothetical protein
MAKTKNKIPEGKLLKALAELEDSVEKGDALQAADPEGHFSTEGTPLSNQAPSGKSDAKKSHDADDDDADDDSSDTSKAFSASDMDSDDDEKPAKKKSKKTAKAFPPPKAKAKDEDSSSDDDSSDDDDSDDDAEKSFRAAAANDETMSKAIEVSDFLGAMVDQLSLTLLTMTKGFQKSFAEMESRLNARIDSRVSKGISMSSDFNARLAKAITAIGTSVEEQNDIVKSLSNAPAAPRGKAMLSKSDVNQPPWGGQGGGSNGHAIGSEVDYSELASLPQEKVGDWLFAKSSRNQIDSRLILAWEANHYDVSTLPEEIQKSLANDLLK